MASKIPLLGPVKRCDCDCPPKPLVGEFSYDPCSCGGLGCTIECLMTTVSGCAKDGDCNTITYPVTSSECGGTQNTFVPCSCEEPPAVLVVTGQVRLLLTGLSPGTDYRSDVTFYRLDDDTILTNVSIEFTASGSTHTSDWFDIPNPAGENEPGWAIQPPGCRVEIIEPL